MEYKNYSAKGLFTFPDEFSEVPQGSLASVNNINVDKEGLFSPRRGLENINNWTNIHNGNTTNYVNGSDIDPSTVNTFFSIKDIPLIYMQNKNIFARLPGDNGEDREVWNWWNGEYSGGVTGRFITLPEDSYRLRTFTNRNSLYLLSNVGVRKIQTKEREPNYNNANNDVMVQNAGLIEPQTIKAHDSDIIDSIGGNYDANDQVAYRIVVGYVDEDNVLHLSPPSNRYVVEIPVGYANAGVDIDIYTYYKGSSLYLPNNSGFVRIYRTKTFNSTDPGDEMFLLTELPYTNSSTGYFDKSSDADLTDPLYTNETQETILQANYPPPLAKDVDNFNGYTFYANCTQPQFILDYLLGTGASGLADEDKVLVQTASQDIYFKFDTAGGGTGSGGISDPYTVSLQTVSGDPLEDIRQTLLNWRFTIENNQLPFRLLDNSSKDATTYAGEFVIQERYPGSCGGVLTFNTLSAGGFYTGTQSAVSQEFTNRIYYSKFQQPEAVPLLNYFDAGNPNTKILRIKASRNSLLIFTEEGIYRLTGSTESAFQISPVDLTAKLLFPESLVSLDNVVYGWFDVGIASVGESVTVVSRPIYQDIKRLAGSHKSVLTQLCFAIGDDAGSQYILSYPSDSTKTYCDKQYVFNTITRQWTQWSIGMSHATVGQDGVMYCATQDALTKRRETYTYKDIVETDFYASPLGISVDNTQIVLSADQASKASIGDIYWETDDKYSIIKSKIGNTIEVTDALTWTDGLYTITGDFLGSSDTTIFGISDTDMDKVQIGDVYTGGSGKAKVIQKDDISNVLYFSMPLSGDYEADLEVTMRRDKKILQQIPFSLEWNPIHAGSPALLKQFSELTLTTRKSLGEISLSFAGLHSQGEGTDIVFNNDTTWGFMGFGDFEFGGYTDAYRYRTLVPMEKQRDSALRVRASFSVVWEDFEISGFSLMVRPIGNRSTR